MLNAQARSNRQVRLDAPFVQNIARYFIEPDRLVLGPRKTLDQFATLCSQTVGVHTVQVAAVGKVGQRERNLQANVKSTKIMIADVVLVPFAAELQSVVANGLRNVIVELNLRDVASLRPDKVVAR